MNVKTRKEHRHKALELPELISGLLVLFVVLWEACFEGVANTPAVRGAFRDSSHLILCGLVWFNTLMVLLRFVQEWRHYGVPGRFLWVQLAVGLAASFIFYAGVWRVVGRWIFLPSLACSFLVGGFSIGTLASVIRARRAGPVKNRSPWSPATRFFTYMLVFVVVSSLLLLTPGATYEPISPIDAFFLCASASSITGLASMDVATTFTPLGKLVLLLDIQVGAIGVMSFSYFVLMMVGRRMAVRDTMSVSAFLDQQGVNIVPALLRAVFFVSLTAEAAGAVCLYYLWQGVPGFTQAELWGHAIFHSVSAFCNAGLSTLPASMEQTGMTDCRSVQVVMMTLMLIGTVGFGVYLEGFTRLKNRLAGKRNQKRWSTHSWLAIRVMIIVMLGGGLLLSLLAAIEPSVHQQADNVRFWESMWNAIGRSAGFSLSDIGDFGPVYQIVLAFLMFVGGNPAGTGGGVFAPVVALCVLEVYRVLSGKSDVEIHARRISRSTVERAMATVVLSIFWIAFTTLLLMLLEPELAEKPQGLLWLFFLEVSAYTTAGYDLGAMPYLSDISKFIISLNMVFGRVGMFTFMMIFIGQKEDSPVRLPETRLPLT